MQVYSLLSSVLPVLEAGKTLGAREHVGLRVRPGRGLISMQVYSLPLVSVEEKTPGVVRDQLPNPAPLTTSCEASP